MKKIERIYKSRFFVNAVFTFSILFVTYLLCMNYKSTVRNTDQLFAQYYQAYEIDDDLYNFYTDNGNFKDVLDLYIACRYDEAFQRLVAMNHDELDTNMVNFLYGQIYLALDNCANANTAFKSVIYDNNNPYTLEAHWYRGLCLLKSKDIEDAHYEFTLLAGMSSKYKEKAQDILTCLDKV